MMLVAQLVCVVLVAAAAEPKPPAGFQRLHPRKVEASSFLANGWNSFEQNYLPPYIADDDPATAWVEGDQGTGVGAALTWLGPTLQKAKTYRVYVRSGYQKSAPLFAANARPKAITLQPVLKGEAGVTPVGTPVKATLKDALGWQEVVVAVPAQVSGVRLTLDAVYPGKKYEDTCISDLQVFVDAADEHSGPAEALAMEDIRRFVMERKKAAARGGKKVWVELAPDYATPWSINMEAAISPDDKPRVEAVQKELLPQGKLGSLLAMLDTMDKSTGGPGWTRVRTARLPGGPTNAKVALSSAQPELFRALPLAHLKTVAFFEGAQDARATARADRKVQLAQKERDACETTCEKQRKADTAAAGEAPEYDGTCSDECGWSNDHSALDAELAEKQASNGTFIRGNIKAPTHVMQQGAYLAGGDREVWVAFSRVLVAYGDDGLARAMVARDKAMTAYLFDWEKRPDGTARLKALTEIYLPDIEYRAPSWAEAAYVIARFEG